MRRSVLSDASSHRGLYAETNKSALGPDYFLSIALHNNVGPALWILRIQRAASVKGIGQRESGLSDKLKSQHHGWPVAMAMSHRSF